MIILPNAFTRCFLIFYTLFWTNDIFFPRLRMQILNLQWIMCYQIKKNFEIKIGKWCVYFLISTMPWASLIFSIRQGILLEVFLIIYCFCFVTIIYLGLTLWRKGANTLRNREIFESRACLKLCKDEKSNSILRWRIRKIAFLALTIGLFLVDKRCRYNCIQSSQIGCIIEEGYLHLVDLGSGSPVRGAASLPSVYLALVMYQQTEFKSLWAQVLSPLFQVLTAAVQVSLYTFKLILRWSRFLSLSSISVSYTAKQKGFNNLSFHFSLIRSSIVITENI